MFGMRASSRRNLTREIGKPSLAAVNSGFAAITPARRSRDYFFGIAAAKTAPREANPMGKSTNSFKYPAMLACALTIMSVGPATAFAGDNDGYSAPFRNGDAPTSRGKGSHGPGTGANLPVLMQPGGTRPEIKTPERLPFGYAPIPTGPL